MFSFFVRGSLIFVRVSGHGVFYLECGGAVGMGLEFDPGVGGGYRYSDHRCGDRGDDSGRELDSVVWGMVGVVSRCWCVISVVIVSRPSCGSRLCLLLWECFLLFLVLVLA